MRGSCPRHIPILIALLAPACAAQRVVPPDPPALSGLPEDLGDVKLTVRSFDVTNLTTEDVQNDGRRRLERAFMTYIGQAATWVVQRRIDGEHAEDAITVDVSIRVDEDSNRTILFDGLFLYPFCGTFPFTPLWGDATVDATMRLSLPDRDEPPIEVKIVAPYSVIFYSWYRVGPIEEAFRRAHDAAFREMIARLVDRVAAYQRRKTALAAIETVLTSTATTNDRPRTTNGAHPTPEERALLVAAVTPPFSEPPPPVEERAPIAAPAGAASTADLLRAAGARELVMLEPEGFNVIDRPFVRRRPPSFLQRYVGSLGGLEASMTGGTADVESRATSAGVDQVVGSGRAVSSGYRVSLYKPPDRTGFFFPPIIGFLSQQIEISGFREDVPLFIPAGSNTVPAIVTDPTTGLGVDLDEPIAYNLDLQSGYIGQGIGLNLVLGTEDVQLFSTMRAGINLFEVRHTDVTLYQSRVEGMSVAFFQSGSVGGQIGIAIPAIHAAIRAAVQYEWFLDFDYPDPLEFQAKVAFNPEKQVFERERVFVKGAALQTFDWQLSIVALF